jgi:hypothetical protein
MPSLWYLGMTATAITTTRADGMEISAFLHGSHPSNEKGLSPVRS